MTVLNLNNFGSRAMTAISCFAILPSVPFKKPKQISDENELYEYAVRALSRKMRTVAELKRLMRLRVPEGEIGQLLVNMVILRLKNQKYLSDSAYAAAYSGFRRDNQKFGPRRVITDLKAKGVHGEVIEKAIDEAYAGVDEMQLARAFLRRKRLRKPADNRAAARIYRALLRAGFGTSVALKLLKKWDVEDEVLSALQEEDESER